MGQITQSKMVKKSKCIKSTINLTILNFPFKRLCLSTWIKNFSYMLLTWDMSGENGMKKFKIKEWEKKVPANCY